MTAVDSGALFRVGRPAGNWVVTVPVPEGEQRQETAEFAYRGKPFTATRLVVQPLPGRRVLYALHGPVTRKDGTPGVRDLERYADLGYLEGTYPLALAEARRVMGDLAAAIRSNADAAVAEVAAARREGNGRP